MTDKSQTTEYREDLEAEYFTGGKAEHDQHPHA